MEIEMFVDFDYLKKRGGLENLKEFEHWNFQCLDLGRSLEFKNQDLDLDFEDLKIENFGYLDFGGSYNFESN